METEIIETGVSTAVLFFTPAVLFWLIGWVQRWVVFPRLIHTLERREKRSMEVLFTAFNKPINWALQIAGLTMGIYLAFSEAHWALPFMPIYMKLAKLSVIALFARGLFDSSETFILLLSHTRNRLDFQRQNPMLDNLLERIYKLAVVVSFGLMILQDLGVPVTGVVTGAGLIGLTVSLGAQDTASNLFAGLLLGLDHPFNIGEWVKIGDAEGSVEDLSLRATSIRTLDQSLITIPNATVIKSDVINMAKRQKWLCKFTFGLPYSSTRQQVEDVVSGVEKLLQGREKVVQDGIIVRFTGFADCWLEILVQFHLDVPDRMAFLDEQNNILLDVMDTVHANGGDFAFPTSTVVLEKE